MKWPDSIRLKLCLHNVENLFLLFDQKPVANRLPENEVEWQKLSSSIYPNKPLQKVKDLVRTIKDIDADVYMFCEVGGPESLTNFNELFLDSQYFCVILEGNSDRNIDVGFLVKKNAPFYFDLQSNKNRPINYLYPHERETLTGPTLIPEGKVQASHKFSRDAAELKLFTTDIEKPFLIILLTHLKSRLDPDRIDPHGFERRGAELSTLIDIYQEIEKKYPGVPIIVAGDLNGFAGKSKTDPEFQVIYQKTQLLDILELAAVPEIQRATHYQIRPSQKIDGRQIDFCFLSTEAQKHLNLSSAAVYRFKDEYGLRIDIPTTMEAKIALPSDHYPVIFELENLKL